MTSDLFPFALEVKAVAAATLIVFAENTAAADEILVERTQELTDALKAGAELSDNDNIHFTLQARGAWGYEMAGSAALPVGQLAFKTVDDLCTCGEDHFDSEGDDE